MKLWNPWVTRNWPALEEEEGNLAVTLASKNVGTSTFERGDITLILDMLRTGAEISEVQKLLPGLQISSLAVAYNHLESLRSVSVNAWLSLRAKPSVDFFEQQRDSINLLFPLFVKILDDAESLGKENFINAVRIIGLRNDDLKEKTELIEHKLRQRLPDHEAEIEAIVLYNPYQPGLWGDPYYIPLRVGTLSPLRVRQLLAEKL